MFPFADEFASFCILKLARLIFLVLQIKHYIILKNNVLFFFPSP